jgi:hypothetical protein
MLVALVEAISPRVLILEQSLESALPLSEIAHPPREVKIAGERQAPPEAAASGAVHLVPSNDTHVHLMRPVAACSSRFEFKIIPGNQEGADRALLEAGLQAESLRRRGIAPAKAILLGNDWGPLEQYWARLYRQQGKPSICLQESVIHLGESRRRMQWCDYPFVQGPTSILPLNRQLVFLTGNPRYQDLRPTPQVGSKRALVNSNFTYGIHEGVRASWIEDVVTACRQAGYDYLISQHPRDRGDLRAYHRIRSHAGIVRDQLKAHSVLITRFSSLIHEALAVGRPVIYYNPHGEDMHYDFEPDGRHLFLLRERRELVTALEGLEELGPRAQEPDEFLERYAARHFGIGDGMASRRVADAVQVVETAGRSLQQGRAIDLLGPTAAHWKRALVRRFAP